jgi:MoaA/NifB/PqqE/SkfB family radical SAM enzyme
MREFHPDDPLRFCAQVAKRAITGEHRPLVIVVHPTDKCNHGCPWCWYTRSPATLDSNLLEHGIKRYGASLDIVSEVVFSGGGEPTLHREFDSLVGLMRSRFPSATFLLKTNGSLLHRMPLDTIRRFQYIRISLDAPSAERYSRAHKVKLAEWGRVWANIARAAEVETVSVGISLVAHETFPDHEIEDLKALCSKFGVSKLFLKPVLSANLERLNFITRGDSLQGGSTNEEIEVFVRSAEFGSSSEGVPSYVASMARHFSPLGNVYPCCHVEHDDRWLLSRIATDPSPSQLLGSTEFWTSYAKAMHPCRVFDIWNAYCDISLRLRLEFRA